MSEEISIDFDSARSIMYEELVEEFGEEVIDNTLEKSLIDTLTQLYDNREKMREDK